MKPARSQSPARGDSRRAVLYARVSSADQELGYSIPAQLELLQSYAREQGIVIEREFVEAETAKKAGRAQFEAMLAYLARNRGCRLVLVEKTDRLSRNLHDIATIDTLGLEVHLVKEKTIVSPDSGANDKLMHGIKVLMAKCYIDNLSEEVKKGMRTKAAQGLWPSYAPLGYKNALGPDQKRIIIPDPVSGPMVTSLFEWFATGEYSLKTLAKRAYEEGFRFRRSQGKVPVTTLQKILRNPIYIGEYVYAGTWSQGSHETLVVPEVWNRVQEILDKRRSKKHRKVTHDFAYTGVVRCGHCDCSMVGEVKKRKYVYYHCTGYRGKCGEPYTPERILDREFATALEGLVIPPAMLQWLEAELAQSDQTHLGALAQAAQRYQTELARSQARLETLYDDRLDGRIDPATYDRKAEEIREQQAQIRERIAEAEAKAGQAGFDVVDLAILTNQTAKLFVSQPAAEQRKLLDLVVQDASWKGGELQVSFREPFAVLRNERATA